MQVTREQLLDILEKICTEQQGIPIARTNLSNALRTLGATNPLARAYRPVNGPRGATVYDDGVAFDVVKLAFQMYGLPYDANKEVPYNAQ